MVMYTAWLVRYLISTNADVCGEEKWYIVDPLLTPKLLYYCRGSTYRGCFLAFVPPGGVFDPLQSQEEGAFYTQEEMNLHFGAFPAIL